MLRANGLIGWDNSLPKSEAAAIFKRRHRAAFWHGLIPFATFMVIGFCFVRFPELKPYGFYIVGFSFVFFLWAYIFVMLCYRCPRCGRIPYTVSGVWVFPKKCLNPKCRAPLLPDHPWAQE
jgi:hypothetical protein